MKVEKLKSWAMIIVAAAACSLAVWQSVVRWKPCSGMGWMIWAMDIACAVISIAYVAKYALILKRSKQN